MTCALLTPHVFPMGKHKEEWDAKDSKLLKYLYENKHTSVFEHCIMTFRFKVPMFVRSQHHRHRTWSFNEISRRYTDENLEFYLPEKWRVQASSSKQASVDGELDHRHWDCGHRRVMERALDEYNQMVEHGVAREMARMVLPQSLYTEYYGTIDLKNAIDFLRLRLHSHAQYEIRVVAQAMQTEMQRLFPETMKYVNFED